MTRDALLAAFAAFPDRFAVAARAAADRPVPDGQWGPSEVGRHLVAVERVVWHVRLEEVATQDDPHWDWTEPGPSPDLEGAALETVLATIAQVRARSVAIVRAFDDAGWARSGTHATAGVLDVAGLLRMANDHDEEHLGGVATQD
jgi:hypothetical protein